MAQTWLKNLNDAEVVVDHFYKTCFEAGNHCALRESSDSSAADIRDRVDAFIQELITSPLSVASRGRVRLVTSLIVRDAIRQALYSPITQYEPLSEMLADALTGNYTLLLETPAAIHYGREDVCTKPSESYPRPNFSWDSESAIGVLCGDSAADAGERNISWAQGIVESLNAQSPTTGEPWSRIPLSCSGWKYRPKYAFRGPFGSASPDTSQSDSTPLTPLLILSTRYDHATPLANAESLSELFPGSAVLIQESVGHCALIASKSSCTAEHMRSYFDTGKAPSNRIVCQEDCSPSIPSKPCPGFAE